MNNTEKPYELIEIDSLTSATPQNTETTALEYISAGLSVLPLGQDKKPSVDWKQYQAQIADPSTIHTWFGNGSVSQIGIVCGSVSNNLEVIDVDEKYNIDPASLLERYKDIVNIHSPGLIDRLVIEKTQKSGYHLIYRCDTIAGNKKLASRPTTADELTTAPDLKCKTLIETRGQGGYIMCAPSLNYALIQGEFNAIPTITLEERTALMEAAKSMNEYIDTPYIVSGINKKKPGIRRPGDDYNIRGNITDVLEAAGWKKAFNSQGVEHWIRPGKSFGVSATFNYIENMFYVFSSNASQFEPEKAYSKFAVYSILKHSGNFEEAATALAEEGYGDSLVSRVETFLTDRYDFRRNIIKGNVEFKSHASSQFEIMTDVALNSLYREIQRHNLKMGIEVIHNVLNSDFTEAYNPFTSYYASLPVWDGKKDYIKELADTVIMKDKNDAGIFQTYLQKWLVNAVACAIDDKIANHNAIVFVGEQGFYKTTWLNRLVPERIGEYKFVGTIDPSNKDTMIHLSECFMINLDEMETLQTRELGTLKSIMSLNHIRVRRPYGHMAENLVRRASFVGSINKGEFLSDETGSRRFLTFDVDNIDWTEPVDIDMAHAQAYTLLKNGFRYWFDQAEIKQVNERNKNFSKGTTEDELLGKYFIPGVIDTKGVLVPPFSEWMTATEIAQKISERMTVTEDGVKTGKSGYPLTQNSAQRFGKALVKGNFPASKSNGSKRYAVQAI
jgi:hypothetical protein